MTAIQPLIPTGIVGVHRGVKCGVHVNETLQRLSICALHHLGLDVVSRAVPQPGYGRHCHQRKFRWLSPDRDPLRQLLGFVILGLTDAMGQKPCGLLHDVQVPVQLHGADTIQVGVVQVRRFRYSIFFGVCGRKRSICDGSRPHAFAVLEAALRVLAVRSSYRWSVGVRRFRSSASLPAG